ncbi:MAG TPA: DUF3108 domain-containing protein [Cytophagales bacterium]|nr:DUF3108 domain-containing protein [Cytophagales bacterium]
MVFRGILIISLAAGITAFSVMPRQQPELKNRSFKNGEVLQYKVFFGFFNVGKASTVVDPKIHYVRGNSCYKIDAFGETSGMVSWITKVNDNWGAYIDSAALIPHISYRILREGKYRKDEMVTYDHVMQKAEVKVLDEARGEYGEGKVFDVPNHVRDLVGGFVYLRVIDFSKMKKGDMFTISGFHEDKAYDLKVTFQGTETLKTDIGNIPCYKLIPEVPDNQLFDGKNSVTCWISAEQIKILVKIAAKMFIGSTGLELYAFKGLRTQLKVVF